MSYVNNPTWSRLNDDQKVYAIEQAYVFAQAKYKQKLCEEYNMNKNLYEDLCKRNAAPDAVARAILGEAKSK